MRGAIYFSSPDERALAFNSMREYCESNLYEHDYVYTYNNGTFSPKDRPQPYTVTYRFSMTPAKKMLVRNPLLSFLGQGSYGSVDFVETESRDFLARKIISRGQSNTYAPNYGFDEANVALDLGVAIEAFQSEGREIILYRYLGESLTSYLRNNLLCDEERLNIAIRMTRAVYNLHSGSKSKSGKKYVHLDIKPDNFAINEGGEVNLIDFGFALPYEGTMPGYFGTPKYLLACRQLHLEKKSTVDAYALVRSLYAPDSPYIQTNKCQTIASPREFRYDFVLSNALYDQIPELFLHDKFMSYGTYHSSEIVSIPKLYMSLLSKKYDLSPNPELTTTQFITQFLRSVEWLGKRRLMTKKHLSVVLDCGEKFEDSCINLKKLGMDSAENIGALLSGADIDNIFNLTVFREALVVYAAQENQDPVKVFYCQEKLKELGANCVITNADIKEAISVLLHTHCSQYFFGGAVSLGKVQEYFDALSPLASSTDTKRVLKDFSSIKREYEVSLQPAKISFDSTDYMALQCY